MPAYRRNAMDRITENPDFDVVVIGGGINGIGTFRDLALQGLRVLLVERNDFSSGCSAAPSRMIHGGLRYLENGEFALVAESLRERDALLRLAPHMVLPLATVIPVLSWFSGLFNAASAFVGSGSKPTRRGALAIKIGLSLYDVVTRRNRLLPSHKFHGRRATHARWPHLGSEIRCSAVYHDAWIRHPERLALELLTDSERESPNSIALNYAELRKGSGNGELFLRGREIEGELAIRTRLIVNATGAWIDQTARSISSDGQEKRHIVSGTKGSHLILDNPELLGALGGHMVFFENEDNRVCILFPYLGKVLAGSTDIKVDQAKRVRCEPEERDYILAAVRGVFPTIPITPEQVVFSFSGIRPLPVSEAEFTGRISRSHFVHRIDGEIPQLCMVGGKWTTFRAFAEQTTDAALDILGKRRLATTLDRAIGGGHGHPGNGRRLAERFQAEFPVNAARASHVAETYGTTGRALLAFCAGRRDDTKLSPDLEMTEAEIAWLIQREHVETLSDIVLRRTTLAITGRLDRNLIDGILAIAMRELGWTGERAKSEREATIEELETYHGVDLGIRIHTMKEKNA